MSNVKITDSGGMEKTKNYVTRSHMNALRGGWSSNAYQAAGRDHSVLMDWDAPFVSGHGALSGEREALAARVHDMVRNDGWVAGAVDKKLFNLVGTGFRLNAMPNWKLLGIELEDAEKFAEQAEALWTDYSTESGFWCDATRTGPVTSVVSEAAYHYIVDGECFGALVWRDQTPTGYSTAMQSIHPQRCSNPLGRMDTVDIKDGVQLDALGAAIGYWFSDAHPGDAFLPGQNPFTWSYIERDTDWGRPRVLHVRRRREAGMVRGVSDLVSFLRKGRQIHKFDDYELSAAALNSLMATFIKTPLDPGMLADALDATNPGAELARSMSTVMDAQSQLYKESPIRMQGAQINFLNPGEEVYLTKPEHPNTGFESFVKFGLRNLASVMGITAEQLTQDWSEVNYSSARAALMEIYKGFKAMTADIINGFLQPWYGAFLEECFDKGLLKVPAGAPDFQSARAAWSQATWIGAPRGYIDPLKEGQASSLRMANGTSTLEREAAEQGQDWRELIRQRARERREMIAAGLDPDAQPSESKDYPNILPDYDEEEAEDKSGADEKRERQARRLSGSGVPIIKRQAA